ncbi:MAG: contact-dependent growth inhibition system immunity protein [Nocardioides sp.]
MIEVPTLKYLMECYYHQDFYEFDGTEWGALDEFLSRDSSLAPKLPAEIAVVLAHVETESELADFVAQLGAQVHWDDTPGGYRGWLAEIARRVSTHLAMTA